jgi:NDP-sugar pyrophosphorylase family protein
MSNRVVILAGGKGTRLRPFTASFPKPLVPVGDVPILGIILRQLAAQGFKHVTLTLGHLSSLIKAYIAQGGALTNTLDISFIEEDRPTGTAGSLARVAGLNDTFLVMNGDILTNLDFGDLLRKHKESGAALTIAGHAKKVKIDLGVLEVNPIGQLQGYVEKPEYAFDVSMGIYVYEPHVLKFIKPNEFLDFPTLVHMLLKAGEIIHVHRNNAFWLDIGRPEDYVKAQEIFESNASMFGVGSTVDAVEVRAF